MLNGLDIEGNSPLHRLPVRGKLIVLFAAAIVLFLLSDLRLLVPALGLSVALYFSTGIGLAEAVRRTRFVLFTVLLVAAANYIFQSPHEGAVVFCRLSTLVLLAAAVTATTGISAFMDEITRLIAPLERFGFVRAADVSLAVGLSSVSCRRFLRATARLRPHTRRAACLCGCSPRSCRSSS